MYSFIARFAASEASPEGIAAFGVNVKSLAFQLLSFTLVFLILKKFALGPIINALEDRRSTISESLKNADEIEKRLAKTEEEVENTLKNARSEADELITKGSTEAQAIIKKAEEDAQKRADKIVADASAKIESDITSARNALKEEMLDLVATATESVTREQLTPDVDEKVISDSLREAA